MSKYPEHAKMKAVKGESQILGRFIDWLQEDRDPKAVLCELRTYKIQCADGREYDTHPEWVPSCGSVEHLLAEYFDIDLKKIEDEKRQMLEELRTSNEKGRATEG